MSKCNKTKQELIHELVERRQIVELIVLESLYNNLKREKNIFIFTFKKVNGRLIYTFCEGELLFRLGFKPEQVIGREISEVNLLKNHNFIDCYLRAWKGEEVFFEGKKSNGKINTLFWLSPIKDKNKVNEVVGLCIEINELKRREQFIHIKEKRELVGRLAAGVAHEIRNPLTSIKGFMQLIELSTALDHREYFNIIKSELNQIETVINSFLILAQPEEISFQKHDMYELLDCVISSLTPLAIMNNVEIKTRIDAYLPQIFCDDSQLKQVFTNIIKNAIEAMPSGGEVCIIMEQLNEETVMIQCVDHGCGIEEERILKLSEPFYNIKEKGIGLGLMISFKIIEEHQGKITINSKVNLGTIVEITLPINPYQSQMVC